MSNDYTERRLSDKLIPLAAGGKFPSLGITGPRQSGKTTLVRHLFPHLPYISLDGRAAHFAETDPSGFLAQCADGAILDEVQRVPELFSYLRGFLDFKATKNPIILTGSQSFTMDRRSAESLAGRIAKFTLLPFSLAEAYGGAPPNLSDALWAGFYPRMRDLALGDEAMTKHYTSYINTYVEHDVAGFINATNRPNFRKLLRLCASKIGQPVNLAEMGSDIRIDYRTVEAWLSILEGSYIIFRVEPYSKSTKHQVAKSPELYFYDTGLACHLLRVRSAAELGDDTNEKMRTLRGHLLENLVAIELKKMIANRDDPYAELFFWRDKSGREVDFVFDDGQHIVPIEVKASQTLKVDHFRHIHYWQAAQQAATGVLIHCGDDRRQFKNTEILPWQAMDELERLLFI